MTSSKFEHDRRRNLLIYRIAFTLITLVIAFIVAEIMLRMDW